MKWVLILAMWNTNPPQDSFKFFTKPYVTQAQCEDALQEAYTLAFNKGVHAQAICVSEKQLGLLGPMY